jgi:predicted PurR-regulated permease PerM
MLMTPACNFLESHKINSVISPMLSTLIVFIVIVAISYLFAYQISLFLKDLPELQEKTEAFVENFQEQIFSVTGLSQEEQGSIIKERSSSILDMVESQMTDFFSGMVNTLLNFLLLFVYVFLFILYRKKFMKFFTMLFESKERQQKTEMVLEKVSKIVHHYLWGRVQVMTILAVLYYPTFLIFDLPFAILLTIFGTLITVIPYLGPAVSGIVPMLFSILYLDNPFNIIIFCIIIFIIQLIESYVLEPLIIGKEVKLNPLAVIIAIISGGIIWGIAGMILFVPLFAAIKIISSHSKSLKPLEYLLENKRH